MQLVLVHTNPCFAVEVPFQGAIILIEAQLSNVGH